ncbi:MAG: DUF3006 domain-containing protein [Oscillospiraceae bacterium]|jgi:hypothetical protein|nr:DUF3006 domain-containing protein [Oscillospiraceae bacterium]
MYFSVDQIGEKYIECENDEGEVYYFKLKNAPKNVKEGDILKLNKNGKLVKDAEQTKKRRKDIKDIYDSLV